MQLLIYNGLLATEPWPVLHRLVLIVVAGTGTKILEWMISYTWECELWNRVDVFVPYMFVYIVYNLEYVWQWKSII